MSGAEPRVKPRTTPGTDLPRTSWPATDAAARFCVLAAAVLWSLSGLLTRVLTNHTAFQPGPEPVDGLALAFGRVLFAGLALAPTVRRADLSFRGLMLPMVLTFALMNLSFVLAMAGGKASNAILLQSTAPLWIYLAGLVGLGEKADRRGVVTLLLGLLGVAVLILGGGPAARPEILALGLFSGVTYAAVIGFLRRLRTSSPQWLTVLNHLGAAVVLLPLVLWRAPPWPGPLQVAILALFGAVQLGLPYWLMARSLRRISAQEAGLISLLEPVLNPTWAYLVAPQVETPTMGTLVGGACIIAALVYRYAPWRPRTAHRALEPQRDMTAPS